MTRHSCIDPEECNGLWRVEACPVDTTFAEDQSSDEWRKYVEINADYYKADSGR